MLTEPVFDEATRCVDSAFAHRTSPFQECQSVRLSGPISAAFAGTGAVMLHFVTKNSFKTIVFTDCSHFPPSMYILNVYKIRPLDALPAVRADLCTSRCAGSYDSFHAIISKNQHEEDYVCFFKHKII